MINAFTFHFLILNNSTSIQFSSVTQSCLTLCDPMDCSKPGFPVHLQLQEFTQTHIHQVGDAIQPSYPLLSPSPPPSTFPSIRVFSTESVLHIRWPKCWSFSFSPSSEYSVLISFRIDWFDLLAGQGIHKSLFQQHSSKTPILWHSVFFMVQLSYLKMTTGKTIALTIWTFAGKVMSLLFNMLPRFALAVFFFKKQASFNFMSAVTICSNFGDQENKICHCFHFFSIYLP